MQREKLGSFIIAALLLINLIVSGFNVASIGVLVENQGIIVENQALIAGHVDGLTDHITELSGELLTIPGQQGEFTLEIHMKAIHRDDDGVILMISEHAGVLTTLGKNYIEDLLGNNGTDPSSQWISLSNDAGAPSAAWTQIPNEIAANNLSRRQGTFTSTGDGVWTQVETFTASGAQSAQLVGLQWEPGASTDNNLLCSDQMTAVAMIANDTLEITWTITVT